MLILKSIRYKNGEPYLGDYIILTDKMEKMNILKFDVYDTETGEITVRDNVTDVRILGVVIATNYSYVKCVSDMLWKFLDYVESVEYKRKKNTMEIPYDNGNIIRINSSSSLINAPMIVYKGNRFQCHHMNLNTIEKNGVFWLLSEDASKKLYVLSILDILNLIQCHIYDKVIQIENRDFTNGHSDIYVITFTDDFETFKIKNIVLGEKKC